MPPRRGPLKPDDVVTHRITLEHIAEGYHLRSFATLRPDNPLIVAAPWVLAGSLAFSAVRRRGRRSSSDG